jgi:hypothetical protein
MHAFISSLQNAEFSGANQARAGPLMAQTLVGPLPDYSERKLTIMVR